MNIEEYRTYCLSKKGVTEGFPFGGETLVFKVMGKMFALTDVDGFESVNLKCDPERALELRSSYEAVNPGYHMNKKHWNTISNNADVDDNRPQLPIGEKLANQKIKRRVRKQLITVYL